jgi:L-alanine-DL-glutamate epimerase-like enolase superfamily enzyme
VSKPTDIRLTLVTTSTEQIDYRTPIKFGGRVVDDVVLLNVTAEVETRDGRRGVGFGSMPMSNVWAWPTQKVPGEQALQAMIALGTNLAAEADTYAEHGHPLEITHDLAQAQSRLANEITAAGGLADSIPRLAQLVAASPLEAAIHDAYGKALGLNAYTVLGEEYVNRDVGSYLSDEFRCRFIIWWARSTRSPMPI